MTTGQGGTRPTHAIWATLLTILAVAGCAREEEPAPAPAPPAPAAAPPPAPAAAAAATIRDSADPLEHGRYLVETVAGCGNCHTPRLPDGTPDTTKNLAGAFVIEEPVFKAYARNITPDMETGIGSWTEDQIVDAVRNARRPDGTFMGPPMSFGWYKNMSDTDVRAIAKYVKSVPAVRNEVPQSTYQIGPGGPPSGQHLRADRHERARRAEDGPREVRRVPRGPRRPLHGLPHDVRHGTDRHEPDRPRRQRLLAAVHLRLGRGVGEHHAASGSWPRRLADDEIKRAITEGISRDGRQLLPFMPYWLYKKMEPSDLDAIVAYLRSLPPHGSCGARGSRVADSRHRSSGAVPAGTAPFSFQRPRLTNSRTAAVLIDSTAPEEPWISSCATRPAS